MKNLIKTFKENKKGRDFISSDVHGAFDLLHEQMKLNAFDSSKDRLFVAGDWCDRNPDSTNILDYIYEPYIHSVRGNHEEMLIEAYEDNLLGNAARMLHQNGGDWFWDCAPDKQKAIYEAFKSLPLAIEIESSQGLIGIIHAEVPYNDWEKFKTATESELEWNVQATAQWARTKYDFQDDESIKGLYKCFVGHTPTKSGEVEQLGNVYYSDLGSFFRHKLCFMEIR